MPAATILSMFGLRAQVISSLFFFFTNAHSYRFLVLVILVAEHLIIGYFLRSFHFWKLYHIALFREGEAVKFERGGEVSVFLELIHHLLM